MNSIVNYVIDFIKIFIPKKDHSVSLRGQISWVFVPILFILWYILPETHTIFSIAMISIAIIGTIETTFYTPLTIITRILSAIFHFLLIVPIFYSKIFNFSKNIKKKSCLKKSVTQKKQKNVKFSNNNKNYYRNDFRYLLSFNIGNFLTFILSIFIILCLPYWPYFMSRNLMLAILVIIYLICWLYPTL